MVGANLGQCFGDRLYETGLKRVLNNRDAAIRTSAQEQWLHRCDEGIGGHRGEIIAGQPLCERIPDDTARLLACPIEASHSSAMRCSRSAGNCASPSHTCSIHDASQPSFFPGDAGKSQEVCPRMKRSREGRCAGNERGSRQGDEILVGSRPLPAAADRNAVSPARLVLRDGSRE